MIDYDYFEDYEEFDEKIEEFKDSLRNEVKDEIKNKIEKLESRNKELEEKQKNLSKLENEYKEKIRKLENEYKEKIRKLEEEKEKEISILKQDFCRKSIEEIIDKVFTCQKLYNIVWKNVKISKCNCCDEDRKIIATDMFGREHKVKCQCDNYKKIYFYEKSKKEVSIWKDRNERKIKLLVKAYSNWSDTYDSQIIVNYSTEDEEEQNYIIEKFDENNLPENYRYAYFTDEKEAQKYVDYLNSKE